MKNLRELIATTIRECLNENQIEQIRNTGVEVNNKIEGGFLNKKQAKELQKDIESNYFFETPDVPNWMPCSLADS
jgi:hypothetical protein